MSWSGLYIFFVFPLFCDFNFVFSLFYGFFADTYSSRSSKFSLFDIDINTYIFINKISIEIHDSSFLN